LFTRRLGGSVVDKVLRYFSFHGRANRQRYWLTVLAVSGLMLLGSLLSYAIPVLGAVVGLPIWLAAVVAGVAVAVRRLHDKGKSAWWMLPMYLPVVVLVYLGELMQTAQGEPNPVFGILTLPFSIWMLVEFGCLRGTVGANRFGPDPLTPELQEVFS
jgi:uncharacterized membrane protein YhaH (DUF805 family)